jgi:ribosomal protein S18 acetylase RimI-like enzyme
MSIIIKRPKPTDSRLFQNIAADLFATPPDLDRVAASLAADGHLTLIAADDELIVGRCSAIVHFHIDRAPDLYVDELAVAPSYRRRGIGRRLLQSMLALGRQEGCVEAWLGTAPDNAAANALYRGATPACAARLQFYLFGPEGSAFPAHPIDTPAATAAVCEVVRQSW